MIPIKHNHPHFLFKSKFHKYSLLYFLASVFILLIVLPLFQKGTFIDGMLYKTVAFDYAEGLSSFWKMKFTNTCMVFFCEQPPLYFYLLGVFYKVLGVNYLTDRVFTLVLFLFLTWSLFLICKHLFKNYRLFFYLSLFFLFTIPVFCWSYVNQVIEPLANVFVAFNILFFVKYISEKKAIYIFLFALGLCMLFLTKGFQSCFISVLPLSYLLVSKISKPIFFYSLISSLFLFCFLGFILLVYQPSKEWFDCYYNTRLVLTMQDVGNTTTNHFEIIGRLFTELVVFVSLLFILMVYLKSKKNYPFKFIIQNFLSNKVAVSLLITTLFGSFPFALSLVQRGFYLVPSFICFILAMLFGFKRYWFYFYLFLVHITKQKSVQFSIVLISIASVIYFVFTVGNFKRDKDLSDDLVLISPYFNQNETVFIEDCLWNYFSLHSYLYMSKKVSLSVSENPSKFYLKDKRDCSKNIPRGAIKINLNTKQLDLYFISENCLESNNPKH